MKLRSIIPCLCMLLPFARTLTAQQPATSTSDTTEAVIDWLRENAIDLRHAEAGNGFADLQPLKETWRDVRVIGLGESTHGTREFSQMKHRLIEFLVTEMGFTAIVIEAPFADAQPINDYVLHGRGDRAEVLTGQWWVPWDTEEFSELLDWMRAYNQTVPDERKVRYYGFDVVSNAVGRAEVLAFLRRVAPARVAAADSLFRVHAAEEARWNTPDSIVRAEAAARLAELQEHLVREQASILARSSPAEIERMLQYIEVMRQSVTARNGENFFVNLTYVIDHELPDTKFILWASDNHVSKAGGLGGRVRERFGDQYYGVGLVFNQGSFQTRLRTPGEPARDLMAMVAPPAPTGTLSWYFSRANLGNFFVDLRGAESDDPMVRGWLSTPRARWSAGWVSRDGQTPTLSSPSVPGENFDGMLFIEHTTPTRPTPNARRTVANRERL